MCLIREFFCENVSECITASHQLKIVNTYDFMFHLKCSRHLLLAFKQSQNFTENFSGHGMRSSLKPVSNISTRSAYYVSLFPFYVYVFGKELFRHSVFYVCWWRSEKKASTPSNSFAQTHSPNRSFARDLAMTFSYLLFLYNRGFQPGVHVPQGYICLSEGVHLRLSIENKNVFAYYLFPNI